MRLPLSTSGLLFAIALAGGCKCKPKPPSPPGTATPAASHLRAATHTTVDALCQALHQVPEQRRAACEHHEADAGTATADCARLLGTAAELGAVTVDSAATSACGAALEHATAGCGWVTQGELPLPDACVGVIQGTREKGAHCDSSLECQRGLHCGGPAPGQAGICVEPGRPGAPCGFAAPDALIDLTRQDVARREHPECVGACEHRRCR